MESIMLLIYVNFSMNNIRRDWIKNSLEKDLHSLYEAGNPPTTLLLGDDHPNKIREAKESSQLTSHTLSQLPRYTRYQKPEWGQSSKECFVTGQHKARHRPQYQNNRQKQYSCFRKCGWRKKFSPGRPQKSGHFRNFSTIRKNFLGDENILQGSEKTLEEEEIFNFVTKDLMN